MRPVLLALALCLAGCDALGFGSSTERVSAERAELLSVGAGEFGGLRALFRYTGSVPDAGCYDISGFTTSTGAPGSAQRNEVTFKDVRAREAADLCASPTTEVAIDSLALGIPVRPPATYRFLFERLDGDPIAVTVRIAADSTVVTG